MKNNPLDRFIGTPEDFSFTLSDEEKCEAQKRKEQFEAELLQELGGNTNPSYDEELAATRKVMDRWHPDEAKNRILREEEEARFEKLILDELNGNTNPTPKEKEAARRRILDRQQRIPRNGTH